MPFAKKWHKIEGGLAKRPDSIIVKGAVAKLFCGEKTFLGKDSFLHPLFPNPFAGIAFIEAIKAIPTYFI